MCFVKGLYIYCFFVDSGGVFLRKLSLPDRDSSKPVLSERDILLINNIGVEGVREQAREILEDKLKVQPENDGVQTPRAGNPVYKAMHACNCESRKSLSRSHRIPAGRLLRDKELEAVVNLVVRWIVREYNFYMDERSERQKSLQDYRD